MQILWWFWKILLCYSHHSALGVYLVRIHVHMFCEQHLVSNTQQNKINENTMWIKKAKYTELFDINTEYSSSSYVNFEIITQNENWTVKCFKRKYDRINNENFNIYHKAFRLKEFMKGVTDKYNWHVERIFSFSCIYYNTLNEIKFRML